MMGATDGHRPVESFVDLVRCHAAAQVRPIRFDHDSKRLARLPVERDVPLVDRDRPIIVTGFCVPLVNRAFGPSYIPHSIDADLPPRGVAGIGGPAYQTQRPLRSAVQLPPPPVENGLRGRVAYSIDRVLDLVGRHGVVVCPVDPGVASLLKRAPAFRQCLFVLGSPGFGREMFIRVFQFDILFQPIPPSGFIFVLIDCAFPLIELASGFVIADFFENSASSPESVGEFWFG